MQASPAKDRWTVRVPDRNYWREQIKCQEACPVYTDSRGYVRAIAEGNDELAYLIARGPNPLASICGRVCGAPCEAACRRGSLDDPVSIRVLKRYVCDKFSGPSSEHQGRAMIDFLVASAGNYPPRDCSDREELLPLLQALSQGDIQKVSGKSVGIIGSGPAGLACAHDLALFGVDVTLYEMEPELGGMLMFGIPEYRLPRDLIRAEVEVITAMGVKGETNCQVGHDVSFPEIRSRHDFTVIAVGAKRSRKLPIPGAEARGVLGGVEFLREVSLGNPHLLEGSVIVIGGGNVAYDVGRTVLRQISVDAARSALRQPETGKVYLCSLESLDEMPADDVEIIEGDEEGIIRKNSMGPREILTNDDGRVRAVRFVRCTRVFDDEGKFSPLFDEDDQTQIECDSVLLSIGQDYDISFIDAERDELAMTDRGMVKCDPVSGQTSAPDIFVAGDLAYGPKLLIHAVASGKEVARSIYHKITDCSITADEVELHFPIPDYDREKDFEKLPRLFAPTAPASERLASQGHQVEKNFSTRGAVCEASRCLDCGVNTIFDGDKCILCGGCVDVCPSRCFRIVHLADLMGGDDPDTQRVLSAQLGEFPAEEASAIIKDETDCIRCGLCAQRCPNGAITMERFHFEEKPKCLRD